MSFNFGGPGSRFSFGHPLGGQPLGRQQPGAVDPSFLLQHLFGMPGPLAAHQEGMNGPQSFEDVLASLFARQQEGDNGPPPTAAAAIATRVAGSAAG